MRSSCHTDHQLTSSMKSFKIPTFVPWVLLAISVLYSIRSGEGRLRKDEGPVQDVNHLNLTGEQDFSVDAGNGTYINIFRKKDGCNMLVRINETGRMLHVFCPSNGTKPWTAIDDPAPGIWIVDSGIDGRPDWSGRTDEEKEIFEELKVRKISRLPDRDKFWTSGDETYEFSATEKDFIKVQN